MVAAPAFDGRTAWVRDGASPAAANKAAARSAMAAETATFLGFWCIVLLLSSSIRRLGRSVTDSIQYTRATILNPAGAKRDIDSAKRDRALPPGRPGPR